MNYLGQHSAPDVLADPETTELGCDFCEKIKQAAQSPVAIGLDTGCLPDIDWTLPGGKPGSIRSYWPWAAAALGLFALVRAGRAVTRRMGGGRDIEFYKDAGGHWRWRLQAGNGRIVAASSEAFGTRAAAERNARTFGPR